jgi:hypothetical protein
MYCVDVVGGVARFNGMGVELKWMPVSKGKKNMGYKRLRYVYAMVVCDVCGKKSLGVGVQGAML